MTSVLLEVVADLVEEEDEVEVGIEVVEAEEEVEDVAELSEVEAFEDEVEAEEGAHLVDEAAVDQEEADEVEVGAALGEVPTLSLNPTDILESSSQKERISSGESVYGEKRISIDGGVEGTKIEYRVWNPFRSKLAAGVLGGLDDIFIAPGKKVLYLGAASGTSVSHVADIVGPEGMVYAVEFSLRSGRDLINMAKKRTNVIPIVEDARMPTKYRMLLSQVDVIFADVAQPDQARIVTLNAEHFLKDGGHVVISIKASCIDSTIAPDLVFAREVQTLQNQRFKALEQVPLEPYERDHAMLPSVPPVSGADPSTCVFDAFRIAIAKKVSEALEPLTLEQAYAGVDYGKKGEDFTVALPRFRLPGKVDELAKKVTEKFQADDFVASVKHDKAFLHFQVNTHSLIREILTQIHTLGDQYGTNISGKGKKIIIEYSSPNIAKSFHVGHLRSTIIGAFLANVYKACGWEVISANYLGDWGTQRCLRISSQFGLIAVGYEKYGFQEELEKDAIKHLFDIYVKINKDAEADPEVKVEAAKFFRRMEDGDESALKNWREWRELSVKKYEAEYDRLNVHFDLYLGESMVGQKSIDNAIKRLDEMGLIEDHEGAKLINLEKYKLGKAVVRKKDGTSIYLTRDIGGAAERYEKHKFDKMIYVISSQQDLHTAQFFKVLELMDYPWAKDLVHINYGLVQGMSTRKGTVVFLNQIIKEAASVMHEQMQKNEEKYNAVEDPEMTSEELGITGVKIQDMAAKRINNYTFNWDRMLSFEGDTGPYLQYAHVRLASIGRKNPHLLPLPSRSEIDITTLTNSSHAREIAFLLGSYPDVVKTALRTHEPSGVVTFAFRLSHAISSAWETVVVKGEEDIEKARARMWLYESAKDVLAASMKLLSIRPLKRM
ncbi:hypothetical protein D9757_007618 [Collybiopsis confluens]|uniref:arginine--tRNA ligase n=1 Tax=Collybiopsis confluens TaxID=2823264 RepID=A0A8H5HA01_9AGAR|nr:hypothetical protein D9757_007618 [Collybiopsis confluens]